jgi:NAD(P)-dependent dehydrogenase (short-subunit alcohol dehydrogenase family)
MADDGGVIVNVSSVRGLEGYPRMAAYSASKFAVNGLTEALAREWQSHDIRVNAVCPGPVGTGFADGEPRDRSRILPEDVADATLFLASEDAEHVTAETLVVSKQDFEYERYD